MSVWCLQPQHHAVTVAGVVTNPDNPGDGDGVVLRFGTQTDTQPLAPAPEQRVLTGHPGGRAAQWPPTWPSTSQNRWPNSASVSDACPR